MAASSSVTAAQALLNRCITGPSPAHADRLAVALGRPERALRATPLKLGVRGPQRRRVHPSTAVRAAAVVEQKVDTEAVVEKSINTIRFLAIDAVEKANSGHPGLPMGCAPMGHILYDEVMRYNPKNPYWFNRDRFVLSAGHGCMLQYALLHLAGYDSVTSEDLKTFRQWGSKLPGHPENFETPGVEVTTGPLGQGIANAVGLALAEKHLAARFNKPDIEIVDHYTYCIVGDGCNMEGISNEACSLAGHWGLGKLIVLYDDNHISIDGDTEIAFTEDVTARFEALGFHTIWVKNGNTGYDELRAAIQEAKAVTDKPTMIKVTTTIGYGSPNKANSYSVHGAALGTKEVEATRQNLGWPYEPFHVPEEVKGHWSRHAAEGAALEAEWNAKFAEYEKKYVEEAAELKSIITGELPAGWDKALPTYTPESPADATRNLSQQCLNALATVIPGFIGGSADLASSNMSLLKMYGDFQSEFPSQEATKIPGSTNPAENDSDQGDDSDVKTTEEEGILEMKQLENGNKPGHTAAHEVHDEKNQFDETPLKEERNEMLKKEEGAGADFPKAEEAPVQMFNFDPFLEGDDDGTEEQQAAFMRELENFHKERSLEFKPPKFYGEGLNCLKLWRAVTRLGGYDQVTSCKLWRQVGVSFKPPKTCTTVSWSFRCFYEKALLEYEKHKIRTGELCFPVSSLPEPMVVDNQIGGNQASGSGRARRDAATRAMQGWHSQRFTNGDVGDPVIKDKTSVSILKRDKHHKSIGSLKRKKAPSLEHAVKVSHRKIFKPQLGSNLILNVFPPCFCKKFLFISTSSKSINQHY